MNSLWVYSSPSPTATWWDFTNNASPLTWDFSKNCLAGGNRVATPIPNASMCRCSGGGLRLNFIGGTTSAPIDVSYQPRFNRDFHAPTYQDLLTNRTRSWRFTRSDGIVFALPVRSATTAYQWTVPTSYGSSTGDYDEHDGIDVGTQLRTAMTATASNANAGTAGVNAWSLQSGLGGLQVAFALPPGAGFETESILHYEYQPTSQNATTNDTTLESCPANAEHVEAVVNAASIITTTEGGHNSQGAESPWSDLMNLAKNGATQVSQGAVSGLVDSGILKQVTRQAMRRYVQPRFARRVSY
jgi:hypothetical protein